MLKFETQFIPVQFFPFPWKPSLQAQLYDPSVFVQLASVWHSLVELFKHSSISTIDDTQTN